MNEIQYILKEWGKGVWTVWEIDKGRQRQRRIAGEFNNKSCGSTGWIPWTEYSKWIANKVTFISKEEAFLKCL